MLTPTDIARVRASFARIAPVRDSVADLFYYRLFKIAPQLRPLFPAELSDQKRKLMQMMATAIAGLGDLEQIVPAVMALGARHAGYGVTSEHYAIVGEALLWTLEHGLGDEFTPDVRAAWVKVYTILATTMQAGAAEVAELRAAE
jgi:nitric oxide dioxygenase